MTNKQIKHRRWLRQTKKQVIKIEKNKVKHHAILCVPSILTFSYKDRIKSIFNFKKESLPNQINHKGKLMPLSINK